MIPLLRKLFSTLLTSLLVLTILVATATSANSTVSSQAWLSHDVPAGLMSALLVASSQSFAEQKVLASGAVNDNFGWSVALSGDTVLVGAYREDVGVYPNQGVAYVFARSGGTWRLEQELTASDGGDGDQFGCSVALSGDGNTALVGAYTHDVVANEDQGVAYVFTRSGTTWTQQAQLMAADGKAGDQFGSSVALSGDTALVGAFYRDAGANIDQGAAYVFTRSGTTWTQQGDPLTASDGLAKDHLGASVALEGDTALVGASAHDLGANANQGAAYVFTRSGTTWTQQGEPLAALDGATGDEFGSSVALSGNTALVGAWYDDVGTNTNQGSAYVFTRSGTAWTQQAQLVASDGQMGDWFGLAVALDGDAAVVGATAYDVGTNANQGAAYIFARNGTTWTQQAHLIDVDGAPDDWLGRSVALDGETALAGAWGHDAGANSNQGAAWVFTSSGATWTPQQKLTASDGEGEDAFGWTVALDGDTALVGAYGNDVAASDQGSVYVFVRSGTTWSLQQKLTAADGEIGDQFGYAVALDGDTALVGVPWDDVGVNMDQGSAYVFRRSGTTWTQQAHLTATTGVDHCWFGSSVALSGDTALVGAPRDEVGPNGGQGSAYVFTRSGTAWSEEARLIASEGVAGDDFGWSVALSGDTALVGAPYAEVKDVLGTAFVFVRSGTTWTQQAYLVPPGTFEVGYFGWSVALLGDTALVGSPGDGVGANSSQGSAYILGRSGTTWNLRQRLTAEDGAEYDEFGLSVALDGDKALVGAYSDDIAAHVDQGSAYIFVLSGTAWQPAVKLIASDGAAEDTFGWSVALDGDTALVGVPGDDIGVNSDQGSAYFYYGSALPSFRVYLPLVVRSMSEGVH